MFKSIKTKLTIPILGIFVVLMVFIVVYATTSVRNLTDSLARQRMYTASYMARTHMESLNERSRMTAYAVSTNNILINFVNNWNMGGDHDVIRQTLMLHFARTGAELGVDHFVLVDGEGNVILRTQEPDRYGDTGLVANTIANAILHGIVSSGYSVTPALPMSRNATSPIRLDGEIIGSVTVLNDMTTNEFVDNTAHAMQAQITVFSGPERVATTVLDNTGQRAVGTLIDEDIGEIVLVQGQEFIGEVELFGNAMMAYYFPLPGWDGEPIGAFFISLDNDYAVSATQSMQINMAALGAAGLALAAVVLVLLIRRQLKPIERLSASVKELADGKVNINFDTAGIGRDEIGMLTRDVISLTNIIKDMVHDLSLVYHEFFGLGNVNYRLDASKYHNSFKDMIDEVNRLLEQQVGVVLGVIDIVKDWGRGNFDAKIEDQPGDMMVLPNTLRVVTANLRGVGTEVRDMIDAVTDGNFSRKIDETKYKGDWNAIVAGLNHVSEAVRVPMAEIERVIERLSVGDFTTKVTGDYKGEFAAMGRALNATTDALSGYIFEMKDVLAAIAHGDLTGGIERDYMGAFSEIRDSINNIIASLAKTLTDIAAASSQVLSGAGQISASAMDLANGAQEQTGTVQQLNSTVDIISRQTMKNADNALEAHSLSNISTTNAQQGNDAMKQMLAAMTHIKDSSNDISKIIRVIQDIAFQTNLLALNAAVEAARAGEHGRGFSVVAEEVRNLAVKSQSAASETTDLIADSMRRVDTGFSIAESTSAALDTIVKNADDVLEVINSISRASQEQADAISQIGTGLSQITQVVQSNSAASEQTAAAAEELNSQAELLRELVAVFKL